MKHQSVSSSTIQSIAHDPSTETLEVKFNNGSTYRYSDVPASVHSDLMDSSSVGKFLNSHIKGQYSHEQV
jgi:hypothetical protein